MLVSREFQFDAAHLLSHYEGKCKNLHGHTYTGKVSVEGGVNSKTRMLVDYNDIKKVINVYDHATLFSNAMYRSDAEDKLLEWCMGYGMNYVVLDSKCTAESIALEIAIRIKQLSSSIDTVTVELHETPDSTAKVVV